ncbi:extracellular ligand-binding receptor [Nostoc carneum NIES-2107]|nr:extracellular ligand-binding receptor [Nostoc carneum NIES-2107]
MVKIALLIGISQYHPDLTSLPGVEEDIKAMQRVLQNPNICGFDAAKTLLNCDRQNIVDEIEQLFSHSEKEDLLLLYFSGHGIKDEYGQLYFATSITRKDERGKLRKATAVEASFVQKIMSNSRSKRQVVILDCCFSGAFAEGLTSKNDGLVDIKNQL